MSVKHIFLAEDEKPVRVSLSLILRRAGYKVTAANDGEEALKRIVAIKKADQPLDLLITDIQMPGMSGMDLIDELATQNISLPILAITGYGDKQMVVDLMRRGCADYIDKPFEPKEMLDRITRIFEKQGQVSDQTSRLIRDRVELNRQIEACTHNFEELRKQIDAASAAYHNLIRIRDQGYNVHVAYRYHPLKELGGDFLDIRNTDIGCNILMADVAGHDMGASYHTVLIKAFFDENCRTGNDGQTFFRLLNTLLLENGKNERMVTAIFLCLDLKEMCGEVISAGHPPLITVSENRDPQSVMSSGDVLGIHEEVSFESRTFPLARGDRFILHTDGLINAYKKRPGSGRGKEKFGTDGLFMIIKDYRNLPLNQMIGQIEAAVTAPSESEYHLNDDMLILGVEIP